MVFKKIEAKKIVNLLELPAKRFLPTFLFLFVFILIFGFFLISRYYFLMQRKNLEEKEQISIKEKIYFDILKIWEDREKIFNGASIKERINPFYQVQNNL